MLRKKSLTSAIWLIQLPAILTGIIVELIGQKWTFKFCSYEQLCKCKLNSPISQVMAVKVQM